MHEDVNALFEQPQMIPMNPKNLFFIQFQEVLWGAKLSAWRYRLMRMYLVNVAMSCQNVFLQPKTDGDFANRYDHCCVKAALRNDIKANSVKF